MPKILVVDDETSVRITIKYFLGNIHGYAITEAKDGLAALNLYEAFSPDLVITDTNMPKMDGLQLAEKILAINPGQPVSLMSGNGRSPESWKGPFIEKPFVSEKLLLIVEHALASRPD